MQVLQAASGGTLASNETYEVQFKVTVNDPGYRQSFPSIMNIARIKATSDANVDFVDDGTAIINPDNGPLPVTMVSFTASLLQDNKVKLDWSTSMEINCSKYIIERSFDGNIFSKLQVLLLVAEPLRYFILIQLWMMFLRQRVQLFITG